MEATGKEKLEQNQKFMLKNGKERNKVCSCGNTTLKTKVCHPYLIVHRDMNVEAANEARRRDPFIQLRA